MANNPLEPLAAIAAPIKDLTDLLNKFLSPAAQEAGEMLGDYIHGCRVNRQIKVLQRAMRDLASRQLEPQPVNLRVLAPLLEAASLEEDEQMAERWASLLASAADPNNRSALEAPFIEILKQLAPTHAFVLDVFYEQIDRDKVPSAEWTNRGYVLSDLRDYLQKDVPQFDVAIENLLRLQLVALPTTRLGMANGQEVRIQVTTSNILCATHLGHAFVSACGRGRTPKCMSYCVPGDSTANVYWTGGGSLRLWTKAEEDAWMGRREIISGK